MVILLSCAERRLGGKVQEEPMKIQTKRIYERPAKADGVRILVDWIWFRGISTLHLEEGVHLKDLLLKPQKASQRWVSRKASSN
jgi:uncharacterized protein YeaO (DUF488 family)